MNAAVADLIMEQVRNPDAEYNPDALALAAEVDRLRALLATEQAVIDAALAWADAADVYANRTTLTTMTEENDALRAAVAAYRAGVADPDDAAASACAQAPYPFYCHSGEWFMGDPCKWCGGRAAGSTESPQP